MDRILEKVKLTKVNGGCSEGSERIIKESPLTIKINGEVYATAMLMAVMEKEYVYGLLYVQGIIRHTTDIKSLKIKDGVADVVLTQYTAKASVPEKVDSSLKVQSEDVFNCVRAILKSEVFMETEAVHSGGLFRRGKETVAIAEDLGRHNALDKVIGAGLLKGVDFAETLAASTGRQPTEMIIKCRAAGIPIIATKGVPTTLAVQMAEKAGITIAGMVRGKSMIIYSHPERII